MILERRAVDSSGALLADRYRLQQQIDSGPWATVWRAWDERLDRARQPGRSKYHRGHSRPFGINYEVRRGWDLAVPDTDEIGSTVSISNKGSKPPIERKGSIVL